MLSGVMLIIVTMFAVLGEYYLSDVLTRSLFHTRQIRNAVVLVATDSPEQMWAGVLDTRAKLPESEIILLCANANTIQPELEPSMQSVTFATPDTIGDAVCRCLGMQMPGNDYKGDAHGANA